MAAVTRCQMVARTRAPLTAALRPRNVSVSAQAEADAAYADGT